MSVRLMSGVKFGRVKRKILKYVLSIRGSLRVVYVKWKRESLKCTFFYLVNDSNFLYYYFDVQSSSVPSLHKMKDYRQYRYVFPIRMSLPKIPSIPYICIALLEVQLKIYPILGKTLKTQGLLLRGVL